MRNKTIINVCYILTLFYLLTGLILSSQVPLNWDSSIIIDGSYRIFLGQAPHTDFSSNIGFLVFLLGSIGFIFGLDGPYASIFFGFYIFYLLIIGWISYRLLIINKLGYMVMVPIIFILSLAFTHRIGGYDALTIGHTGLYNDIGNFLITIMCLQLFVVFSYEKNRIYKKDIIFLAVILAFLFIGKITFFLVALPVLSLLLIKDVKALIKLLFLSLGLVLIVYYILGVSVTDVIADINLTAQNKNIFNILFSLENLKLHILGSPIQYYFAVIIATFGLIRLNVVSILQGVGVGLTVIILSYLLSTTNGQKPDPFLPVLYSLIFIMYMSSLLFTNKMHKAISTGLLLSLIISVILVSERIVLNTKANIEWISYHLHDLYTDTNEFITRITPNPEYNIACIEPYIKHKASKIISVGSNNIFSHYFKLDPPQKTLLYWHNRVTFSEIAAKQNKLLLSERVLSDANLIFFDITKHRGSVDVFKRIYGDYLKINFFEAKNTDSCVVLVRKK